MRSPTKVLWSALLTAAVPLLLAVPQGGAASGDDVFIVPGGPEGPAGSASHSSHFDPTELTVEVGQAVTWTNKDYGKVHSVTADDGSFDSSPDCSNANPGKCLDDRQQFTWVFSAEGRFPYHSKTSGAPGGQGTAGVIVVVPAGTAAP